MIDFGAPKKGYELLENAGISARVKEVRKPDKT